MEFRNGLHISHLPGIEYLTGEKDWDSLIKADSSNEILLGTKTTEKDYLNSDIERKLQQCSTKQKQLILDFIDLIVKEKYNE